MRRISNLSVLCLAAGVMAACSLPDEIITTENIPTAGVRFINAVPDTNLVDMRFYDFVESNAHFRIGFRANPVAAGGVTASTQVQYKNARAASRKFRVFLNDTLQSVASKVLYDITFTFQAGKNYTVWMMGNARRNGVVGATDTMRLNVVEDAPADPGALVALRLVNATNAVINGRQYTGAAVVAQGATVPTSTTGWPSLAPYTIGSYITVPVTVSPNSVRYNIRNPTDVDGTGNLFADGSALIGAVAGRSLGATVDDLEPLPGTAAAGSAVTGVVYPASVVGSRAVQFTTPGLSFIWDRRPPRTGCLPYC